MLQAELSYLRDDGSVSQSRIICYPFGSLLRVDLKAALYRDKNLIGVGKPLLSSIALNSFVRRAYMLDLPSVGRFAGLALGPIERSAGAAL